jgi:hypothetical protein
MAGRIDLGRRQADLQWKLHFLLVAQLLDDLHTAIAALPPQRT